MLQAIAVASLAAEGAVVWTERRDVGCLQRTCKSRARSFSERHLRTGAGHAIAISRSGWLNPILPFPPLPAVRLEIAEDGQSTEAAANAWMSNAWGPPFAAPGYIRASRGLRPVQRLNARENAAWSENPTR
jgi:hypothetical protein